MASNPGPLGAFAEALSRSTKSNSKPSYKAAYDARQKAAEIPDDYKPSSTPATPAATFKPSDY